MIPKATVYLIPCFLDDASLQVIPPYVLDAVKECQVFFVENERSARRYFKALWKEMVIDDYQWVVIHKAEQQVQGQLKQALNEGKTIGIVSEAGCPGIADPGQLLVGVAHEKGAIVKPLVGPSSILLALMASGMNGQHFRFAGYMPIDSSDRVQFVQLMEADSLERKCTQVFIETPYRNNPIIEMLLKTCRPNTRLCIAADLTSPTEYIKTLTIAEWKKHVPDLHKRPAIFCLMAGE
jgi:16S rRNA (cytidine1402-2'-O)-methyltransferase